MPTIISLDQIQAILPQLDLLPDISAAFARYSEGRAVVPPVGELLLEKGEVHIKYGFLQEDDFYVIKIASGFYNNPALGLPSSNGMMLLFSQETGELTAILLDEGRLTNIRTAVAGAIVARHLAPSRVERIGIVGAGAQGRLQLEHLRTETSCRDVLVWGMNQEELARYVADMTPLGFRIETTEDPGDILPTCNLIVTTTPSTTPLLSANDLRPGVHITAMGSDTPEKQELDARMLARADLVVADSISQCQSRGEIYQALSAKLFVPDEIVELGDIIAGRAPGRTSDDQITIADLTGVAVQDIAIATAVYRAIS